MGSKLRTPSRIACAGLGLVLALIATACIATGTWQSNTVAVTDPFTLLDPRLDAVSCIGESFCLTAGSGVDPSSGDQRALVMRWDGEDVTELDVGIPDGLDPMPTGASCAGVDDCLLVVRVSAPGDPHDLVYHYDGASFVDISWSAGFVGDLVIDCLPAPNPACLAIDDANTYLWDPFEFEITDIGDTTSTGTLDLSCIAVDLCIATDGTATAQFWSWGDGATRFWAPVPLVHPDGGTISATAVDCTEATVDFGAGLCLVVGSRTPAGGGPAIPMAMKVDPFTAVATSIALNNTAPTGALTSASCTGGYSCVALGVDGFGVPLAVAGYPKSELIRATAPPLGPGIVYPGLSCAAGTSACVAVGRFDGSGGTSAVVANYDWP